jgi:uncharacterized protein
MAVDKPLTDPEFAYPTPSSDRIVALDVLRGFALLGILLVNILDFSGVANSDRIEAGPVDNLVSSVIGFFAGGKFISMFAMLFGIGFVIQLARIEKSASNHLAVYGRRLMVLLIIGMAHLFFDPAEVLFSYAFCGALLLLFRRVFSGGLLICALVLMTLPYLHTAIVTAFGITSGGANWNPYVGEVAAQVYSSGSFTEVLSYNSQFALNARTSWVGYLWMIVPLPLMLIGAYIGRRRILERIHENLPVIRKAFWIGIAGGIAVSYLSRVLFGLAAADGWDPWLAFVASVAWMLGRWAMALGYAAGIVLLLQHGFAQLILRPLQAVGKLALSNYLLQTLICTTIFYGYGGGLYGSLGAGAIFLMALLIYALQVFLSAAWAKRFRFGPAEWLWRSLTYGSIQPMRLMVTNT